MPDDAFENQFIITFIGADFMLTNCLSIDCPTANLVASNLIMYRFMLAVVGINHSSDQYKGAAVTKFMCHFFEIVRW